MPVVDRLCHCNWSPIGVSVVYSPAWTLEQRRQRGEVNREVVNKNSRGQGQGHELRMRWMSDVL